jgi:hypothetical protein
MHNLVHGASGPLKVKRLDGQKHFMTMKIQVPKHESNNWL